MDGDMDNSLELRRSVTLICWKCNLSLFNLHQVLTKDLEKKEQANTRLLNEYHDMQSSIDKAEREKDRLYIQLEETLIKLKDQTK